MTRDQQPTTLRRRWSQFSLATIFVLTTLVAIGCWGYWVALPRWRLYQQQMAFEESVKLLRSGVTLSAANKVICWPSKETTSMQTYDAQRRPVEMVIYDWPNATYFVYYVLLEMPNDRRFRQPSCISVEVFCVPPIPLDYQVKSEKRRDKANRSKRENAAKFAYCGDYFDFFTGDRKDDHGLKYEIIHADRAQPAAP
jgi:hypothetical protein